MPDLDPDHVAVLAAKLHAVECHPGLLPFARCSMRHRSRDIRQARMVLTGLAEAGYTLTTKET
jgi:3-dehydroquinate dehydratase